VASSGYSPRVGPESPGSGILDKGVVLAHLEKVLSSKHFSQSKRYPGFLRYVVERTLEGSGDRLKERTLGVDVFGRDPDYDTSADPVVRVTAAEVRKRLQEYYGDSTGNGELRISLPVGSYTPAIHLPSNVLDVEDTPSTASTRSARWTRRLPVALAVFGLLGLATMWWRPWAQPSALDLFWQPLLDRESAVSLCVAGGLAPLDSTAAAQVMANARLSPSIAWSDSSVAVNLAGFLAARGQPYQLRRIEATTLEDLRRAPAVMIGAFNDVWTLRVTDSLRFSFVRDGPLRWIQDSQSPSSRQWSVDPRVVDQHGDPTITRDYAVISRILKPRTGKPVVIVAGTFGFGTQIAGEFATNEALLASIAGKAPSGWQNRNAQIVVSTEVIDGHAGPPTLLATHFW